MNSFEDSNRYPPPKRNVLHISFKACPLLYFLSNTQCKMRQQALNRCQQALHNWKLTLRQYNCFWTGVNTYCKHENVHWICFNVRCNRVNVHWISYNWHWGSFNHKYKIAHPNGAFIMQGIIILQRGHRYAA